ncbi:MAG: hypothetical protein AAFW89_03480 [Bacteroidota bacterium]
MKNTLAFILCSLLLGCSGKNEAPGTEKNPPSFILGNHQDDYAITYTIDEQVWLQHPEAKYNILEWVPEEQYLIAQNDSSNASYAGLFTRIDWIELSGMPPYEWAFCLSSYDATSVKEAASVTIANRDEPKSGCNGFPFSRMQPALK